MKHGEISSAGEMKRKYGLTCDSRPTIRLRPEAVPANLIDLIPMAEKWGIGDDMIRGECNDGSTPQERTAFAAALKGRTAEVSRWLDTFPQGKPMTEEAAAFMYMGSALEELRIWPDPPSKPVAPAG